MKNPLLQIVVAAVIAAIATMAIKKGMDWHAADTAPLMYLTVDHLPAADCNALPKGLAGLPEPGDVCKLRGYVYSRPSGCEAGGDAWGVSQQRHGRGSFAVFCLPRPGVAPASDVRGIIRSYEAVAVTP